MKDQFNLTFVISGEWKSGVDSISTIINRIKEKNPDSEIRVEVQFSN